MTTLRTRVPVRIDLAGGTVDIWPLYLLIRDATTVNLGINLFAETSITASERKPAGRDPEVRLVSEDQGTELALSWSELPGASTVPGLVLHQKLLSYFAEQHPRKRPKSIVVRTRAQSPAGAGLGGSSALNIALTGGLAALFEGKGALRDDRAKERLIEIARDVETRILGVPAGLQDYYGAMFGGLQDLHWQVARHSRRAFHPSLQKKLAARLLLFYSGQSRNSGINNWLLFKSCIDRDAATLRRFEGIATATRALSSALSAGDWPQAREAIVREWAARRELASGISTPEMDRACSLASAVAPIGFKVCGAGGGGCFMVLLESDDPAVREKVNQAVCSVPGIRALPFEPAGRGLELRTGNR